MTAKAKLPFFLLLVSLGLLTGCASSDSEFQCGVVSTYLKPDSEQYLYRTVVTHLDGKPVISRPNYFLDVGEHELTLVELVNSPELKVSLSARGPKTLKVTVEPNQRYHIAAQMQTDKIYVGRNKNFWQPIVFQQEEYECQREEKR
ncbi:hypothetical protein [Shewanella gaetbuli]